MARLPAALIERVKTQISLERLVTAAGITLKGHGKDRVGHCPFHEDKTPSFVVSPKSNLWHCLGACGEGGSVIDWVMKREGVDFRTAVEELRDRYLAAPTASAQNGADRPSASAAASLLPTDVSDAEVLSQVIAYYHGVLKSAPAAQAYLAKRGLDDVELIETFKLGYANRTLGLSLPQRNRKAGAAIRGQLQRIGLYRETGREHFNGSLVIPVIDASGVIREVYGRKLCDKLRKGTPKHTYLPGPHAGVFNPAGIDGSEEVILCESLIDALTFWRWGFRHVTASYGVNGFTDALRRCLVGGPTQRVLIAYDADAAGDAAADTVATTLMADGLACYRVRFPKGMDANAYACSVSPAQRALALVIRKAEWMGDGAEPERTRVCAPVHDAESLAEPVVSADEPVTTEAEMADTAAVDTVTVDTAATPVPPAPVPTAPSSLPADAEVQVGDEELFITLGDRVYRVRGLSKNRDHDQLKIQLLVRKGEAFHMDRLDLYSSKQRQVFINQASVELGVTDTVIKKDLGAVLLTLEAQQVATPVADTAPVSLDRAEREAALELLEDPALLSRILADFTLAGVVGEETNKLAGYLACVSRKLARPLALLIQSSSAAGKSSLMDAILAMMPEESRVQYSAMTGQSLFYMGETNLKHKILAISEEEGASQASYALKLLQSEGEVRIASTGKDESSGNLVTKDYAVQGPVMLFLTTTAIDLDEELLNRCLVLTVNESRQQTEAIHAAQRSSRTLQGLRNRLDKARVIALHGNAQRLLKPLCVINPYADRLTFLNDKTRTRRDHEKYLTLIDSIALLHQYQRPVKTVVHDGETVDYIEVALSDIETANRLAHEILGRSLDELPPQTRRLLKKIQAMVQRECAAQGIEPAQYRFSRKTVRAATGWGNTQLKVHLHRLQDLEYLLVHRGGRGQSFEYELLYDARDDGERHLMGLIDTTALEACDYDATRSGVEAPRSAPGRGSVGARSASMKSLPANGHAGSGVGRSVPASRTSGGV